jgi:hypothetical protein
MEVTKEFKITTKVPGGFSTDGSTAKGVQNYAKQSVEALQVDGVGLSYRVFTILLLTMR